MCGIFGFFNTFSSIDQRKEELKKMSAVTRHRGPNDFQQFHSDDYSLGSNRLSITDIQNGSQPFTDPTGNIKCFFNGEIYNYKKLKIELISKGYHFYSDCDGEILPALYSEYGYDFLSYLDGMFSICLFNQELNELLLAVDSFSIKPLYYTVNSKLIFCSEIKGIAMLKKDLSVLDDQMLSYLFYKAVFPPETAFKDIQKLEPGTFLIIKNGVVKEKVRYETKSTISPEKIKNCNLKELTNQFTEKLIDTVIEMIPKEVNFGCLLSGGLDSSSLISILNMYSFDKFNAYSIGYDEELIDDERKYARKLSKDLNFPLHEVILTPDEIPTLLEKIAWSLEEPIQDPITIPTYKVIEHAKAQNTVLFTGDGADELFGGYNRYKTFLTSGKIAYLNELGTLSLDLFKSKLQKNNWIDSFEKLISSKATLEEIMLTEQITRLPSYHLVRLDKLSMANSLEARVPFLRNIVKEYSQFINGRFGSIKEENEKWFLKNAVRNIVPDYIINRRKKPFTLPINKWIKNELYDFIYETLLSNDSQSQRFLSHKEILDILEKNRKNEMEYSNFIWSLLSLEYFYNNVKKLNKKELIKI